MFWQI